MRFLAELISEDIKFDTSEILDVQWIDIDALKNMGEDEVRGHDIAMKTLIDLEENNVYPLEIYDDRIYKEISSGRNEKNFAVAVSNDNEKVSVQRDNYSNKVNLDLKIFLYNGMIKTGILAKKSK